MNYLNFCFWLLEWECHFLIRWQVFKLLYMVYSKYPFFVCPPSVLGLLLLSHKLHSVVGSPGFHQQCTIRPNVTIRAMGILHFLDLLLFSSCIMHNLIMIIFDIPSTYGPSTKICNFTHFSITVLLNNWLKAWGNPDIVFPEVYIWNASVSIRSICTWPHISKHTCTHVLQCSLASVGHAQAHPNYSTVCMYMQLTGLWGCMNVQELTCNDKLCDVEMFEKVCMTC